MISTNVWFCLINLYLLLTTLVETVISGEPRITSCSCCASEGTPALTSRGLNENDFIQVVAFIDEAVQIASHVKAKTGDFFSFTLIIPCHSERIVWSFYGFNNKRLWHLTKYLLVQCNYL